MFFNTVLLYRRIVGNELYVVKVNRLVDIVLRRVRHIDVNTRNRRIGSQILTACIAHIGDRENKITLKTSHRATVTSSPQLTRSAASSTKTSRKKTQFFHVVLLRFQTIEADHKPTASSSVLLEDRTAVSRANDRAPRFTVFILYPPKKIKCFLNIFNIFCIF